MAEELRISVEGCMLLHGVVRAKSRDPFMKKDLLEVLAGDDVQRKTGKWARKERVIDRTEDHYREVLTDPETGQILHYCSEPLSEHQGHGSAKNRRTRPQMAAGAAR